MNEPVLIFLTDLIYPPYKPYNMPETPNAIEVLKQEPEQTEKEFLEARLEVWKEIYQTCQRNAEQAKQQMKSIEKAIKQFES